MGEELACGVEPCAVEIGEINRRLMKGGEGGTGNDLVPFKTNMEEALEGTGSAKMPNDIV
jgi:hypothetical protein